MPQQVSTPILWNATTKLTFDNALEFTNVYICASQLSDNSHFLFGPLFALC